MSESDKKMIDTPTPMNRNHCRAPVSAKTRAVLIDDGKRAFVKKRFDIPGVNEMITGGENAVGTVMSSLVTALFQIEEKLDRILEKLEGQEPGVREITVFDTLDISGSGISLTLSENLDNGSMMRLSIVLPGYLHGRLETLGRVVRSEEIRDDDGVYYQTGIEFVDLSDEEKERLVQYTFSQQRRHIRASGNGEK